MKTIISGTLCRVAAVCAVCAVTVEASASIIHGDFSLIPPGAIEYLDVTESSTTDPVPPARYGAPVVSAAAPNTLDFTPTSFGAAAIGGSPAADIIDAQLNFDFELIPGTGLSALAFEERGDYGFFGSGTAATSVAAGIFVEVVVTEVNGSLVTPFSVTGSAQFDADVVSSPGLNQNWSNALTVDFVPDLISEGFSASDLVTAGEVVVSDTLVTLSEASPTTVAFINKEDFQVLPIGTLVAIPEPSTVLLAGLAVVGLATRRR